MNQSKTFVHRANFVDMDTDPFGQLHYFRQLGFRNLEIDVTVTGTNSYKFCHPSMLKSTSTEYPFDSPLFEKLAVVHKDVLWLVDIKYLDADAPPTKLVKNIYATLGSRVIFSAALPQLLTTAHDVGALTAHFFRPGINVDLPFTADYFILKSTEPLNYPLVKTILHCSSMGEAAQYLAKDVAYTMVDGEKLLTPQKKLSAAMRDSNPCNR